MINGYCSSKYNDDDTRARRKTKRQRSTDDDSVIQNAPHRAENNHRGRRMYQWNGNGQIELGVRCGFMSKDRYMDSYEYRRKEIYIAQLRWNVESIMKRSFAIDFNLMNCNNGNSSMSGSDSISERNSLQVIDIRNDISNSAVTPFLTQSHGVKSLLFSKDDKMIIGSTTHGSLISWNVNYLQREISRFGQEICNFDNQGDNIIPSDFSQTLLGMSDDVFYHANSESIKSFRNGDITTLAKSSSLSNNNIFTSIDIQYASSASSLSNSSELLCVSRAPSQIPYQNLLLSKPSISIIDPRISSDNQSNTIYLESGDYLQTVRFSPCHNEIVACSNTNIEMFDLRVMKQNLESGFQVSFPGIGKKLSPKWDTAVQNFRGKEFHYHKEEISSFWIVDPNRIITSTRNGNEIRLWNMGDKTGLCSFQLPQYIIPNASWLPPFQIAVPCQQSDYRSTIFAAPYHDKLMHIFSIPNEINIDASLICEESPIASLLMDFNAPRVNSPMNMLSNAAISNDGTMLASCDVSNKSLSVRFLL